MNPSSLYHAIWIRREELQVTGLRMKRLAIIFLGAAALLTEACAPSYYGSGYYAAGPPAPATGVVVAVGDQPYYTHGPYYVNGGRRYVWVAGHWGHRHGRR